MVAIITTIAVKSSTICGNLFSFKQNILPWASLNLQDNQVVTFHSASKNFKNM